jgi:hypothetical protein
VPRNLDRENALSHSCCEAQRFVRDPDQAIADIGSGGGVEFTVGNCGSCSSRLVHCWIGGGISEATVAVDQSTVEQWLEEKNPKARKALLTAWFEGP